MNRILVAGHRGYRAKYPENTLLSFQKALELGVDMLEFDLNLTKDKRLVVIHDQTVDRTTNGSGFVRDLTLEEIKELDAGVRFSEEFARQKIPTLEEFLTLVADYRDLLFNVEIKEKTYETVDLTVETLKAFGVLDRCVMTCFDAHILKYIRRTYHVRCQGFPGQLMKNFEEGEDGTYSLCYSVGVDLKLLTREQAEFFQSRGIQVWPYPVNDEEWARKTIELGGTLVTCDDPVPALNVFKAAGYHD